MTMLHNLVNKKVPNFKGTCFYEDKVQNLDLYQFKGNSILLLLFYPADFTSTCSSEIIAISSLAKTLSSKNTKVMLVSTDSVFCHEAFNKTLDISIPYPMVSDVTKQISRMYNVLDESNGMCTRAHYLIDAHNIASVCNAQSFGRSTTEIIRQVDAINHMHRTGEKCLCNWSKE